MIRHVLSQALRFMKFVCDRGQELRLQLAVVDDRSRSTVDSVSSAEDVAL